MHVRGMASPLTAQQLSARVPVLTSFESNPSRTQNQQSPDMQTAQETHKQLDVADALLYLNLVKEQLGDQPAKYNECIRGAPFDS